VDATGQRVSCAVLFVVNRSDCTSFRPCHEADPLFANVLRRAEQAGVLVLAYDVRWSGPDGRAALGKRLPVRYGEGVTGEVDEEHLALVLKFNATDPRTHWRKAAGGGAGKGKKAAGGQGGGAGNAKGKGKKAAGGGAGAAQG
jgi:hypothetical protein